MRLQFLGANNIVTGSCTSVELPSGKKILIDCGIVQDSSLDYDAVYKLNSRKFEFDLEDVSHVILTHAHLDHIGRMPLLLKMGYKGKVLATEPTGRLALINLKDAAHLMEKEAEVRNKRKKKGSNYEGLYSMAEAERAARRIQCYDYNKEVHLDKDTTVEFIPNGHIVGSAMIKIQHTTKDEGVKSILFTGDTSGFSDRHPFINPAQKIGRVDTIVTEATYGGKLHKHTDIRKAMADIIRETCIDKNKTLLLPVFSIQRSTELSQIIYEVCRDNEDLGHLPVYLDSPMAIDSTEVIDQSQGFWVEGWLDKDTFFKSDFITYVKDSKGSKALANGTPKIILSSSGMMQGGRILHHLVSFLPSRGCTVLLTGYCGEGTLAHKLLNTDQGSISILKRQVAIRADIEHLPFSSHADQNELVELIGSANKNTLKKIFIMHGSESESRALKKRLEEDYTGVKIRIPKYKQRIKI